MRQLVKLSIIIVLFGVITVAFADEAKKAEANEEAIFTLQGEKVAAEASGKRKLYHWPYLKGLPYTSAEFVEYPDGDICNSRAFYWGRVIGSDGVHIPLRGFVKLEDNLMARPFVESEEEREALTDRLRRFQEIYSKYGCVDNALGVYMDKPIEGESLEEFKANVYKYGKERAELAKAAGIPKILIDMEWSNLEELKEKIGPRQACLYAWEVGKELMRALNDSYPEVELGFYPGLTGTQYNIEKRINPELNRFSTRTPFVQGMYDNKKKVKMFHFVGWTYCVTDQCTGTKWWKVKEPPFVNDTTDMTERTMYAHKWLLGDDLRYEWGRWELGNYRYRKPGVPGQAMIKLANVPLAALERTWKKLYQKSNVIWVWDNHNSWDEDGSTYVSINNDEEMEGFEKWLDEVDPAYHKLYDAVTCEYWIPGAAHTGFKGTKRDMFKFITKDGVTHITGILDPQFVKYVNLTKELAGRDRDIIPLYSQEDVELAKKYKEKGYFPYQVLKMGSEEPDIIGYLMPIKKTETVLGRKLN